jgi:uncharacterized membrane protein YqjE
MFERLTVAATLVVRHVGAYTDLILSDAEEARREAGRRVWASALMATAMMFALAMACLLLIAATWDTPARLWTVAGLLCVFLVLSVVAYSRLRGLGARIPLFARTAREWEKDRHLIEQLLNGATPPREQDGN